MEEYYDTQVKALTERKLAIDKIKLQDQEQAVEYQKKLFNFEKTYFELDEMIENMTGKVNGVLRRQEMNFLERERLLAQ